MCYYYIFKDKFKGRGSGEAQEDPAALGGTVPPPNPSALRSQTANTLRLTRRLSPPGVWLLLGLKCRPQGSPPGSVHPASAADWFPLALRHRPGQVSAGAGFGRGRFWPGQAPDAVVEAVRWWQLMGKTTRRELPVTRGWDGLGVDLRSSAVAVSPSALAFRVQL